MTKILPSSVDLGAGDSSGYNPINIGGNTGLPTAVSSPLGSGSTSTKQSIPAPGPGPKSLD